MVWIAMADTPISTSASTFDVRCDKRKTQGLSRNISAAIYVSSLPEKFAQSLMRAVTKTLKILRETSSMTKNYNNFAASFALNSFVT